jgi:outer membrane lipoprotein
MRILVTFFLGLLLSGCVTAPKLDKTQVNSSLTVSRTVNQINSVRGQRILWGGTIVSGKNLKDRTQLEILAYPLSENDRPQLNEPPQGRFILEYTGYLETAEYAPGRMITVIGPVTGTLEGRIGESQYVYPSVSAEQLYLWPRDSDYSDSSEPQIHFGVGVIFH